MEGWKSLILGFDRLEGETRNSMINAFCESMEGVSLSELSQSLSKGKSFTIISLKLLEKKGNMPGFKELIGLSHSVENSSDVFSYALKYYKEDFMTEVLCKTFECSLKRQEEILETVRTIQEPCIKDLENILLSIQNIAKFFEENTDLSINLHHRCANELIKKNKELAVSFFDNSYFKTNVKVSKELVHYIDTVPQSFFSNQVMKNLESDLLDKDLYIRKNATLLIKKNSLLVKGPEWAQFWEIYETLENYNKAIISGPWKRIYSLFAWDIKMVELLYKRGQMHENLTVRRFIAKSYMKQSAYHEDFTASTFIEFLANPGLYSDCVELVGKSKFGELVTGFLVKYIKKSPKSLQKIMKNALECVQFQVAFRYFLDAFLETFNEAVVDKEMLEKAYQAIFKQISQLTPFQRHKSFRLLQMLVEGSDDRFFREKIRIAVKVPMLCRVRFNQSEVLDICQKSFGQIFGQGDLEISLAELGYMFSVSFDRDSMKMCGSLLNGLQSIYRNSYLKPEVVKIWVQSMYYIIKYLNKHDKEPISSYLNLVLDETFIYTYSQTDKELIKHSSKLIKQIIANSKTIYIPWSLSKLSLIASNFQSNSSHFSILTLSYYISKSILKYPSPEFNLTFKLLSETILNASLYQKDNFYELVELKWKTLAMLQSYSNLNLFETVADQLDSANHRLLETLFDILAKTINSSIENLESILNKAWSLVLETKNDAPLGIIFSFSRLAFNKHTLFLPSTPDLLKKVIKKGQDRWGIVRIVLYQLASLWIEHSECLHFYLDPIFDLTYYEETRSEDTEFLVPCVFALVNTPKPHIKGDSASLRSQYVRVFTLNLIKNTKNQTFLAKLLETTLNHLQEACEDKGEFPNSWVYKKKIRMGHLLCTLAPWCSAECSKNDLKTSVIKLIEVLKVAYVHSARQYIERFLIQILLKYPELTELIEADYDMKPQLAGSFMMILGAVMVFSPAESYKSQIFSKILPFMISNTAHIRRSAHFVIYKFLQLNEPFRSISPIFQYLFSNKECQKMMKKLENTLQSFDSLKTCDLDFVLSGFFSEFDEIVHTPLLSEIEEHCKYLLDTNYEINYQELWKNLAQGLPEPAELIQNFQRKVESTPALVELRTSKGIQKRHELVIVASLVDKIPNLAGLTRTAEVFNLQMITFAAKNVLNESEFKSMAVTADKWLPIMEVGKSDIEKFLRLYRQKGYVIIGLEQTANSVSIESFKFKGKSVLVLGHEKDGIPSQLLSVLDACLEIPQFGLIRSLNVHVSASICIWEYMKQLYL